MFWDLKSGTLIIIFLLGVFMLYQVVDRSPPFAIKPCLYESIFGYIVIIQRQDSRRFLREWRWWWGGHNKQSRIFYKFFFISRMTDYDLFAMINFRGMKHKINKVTHVIVVRQTREYINCLSLILGLGNYI